MKPGDSVTWYSTDGGGGGSGHRVNTKTPRAAEVLKVTERSVRIRVGNRVAPFDTTWVRKINVFPAKPAPREA